MAKVKQCTCVGGIFVTASLALSLLFWKEKSGLMPSISFKEEGNQRFVHDFTIHRNKEIRWYNYTIVGQKKFFIFSVIAAKSVRNHPWDLIVVNGWEAGAAVNDSYKCCYYDGLGNKAHSISTEKRRFVYRSYVLDATQVVCKIPQDFSPKTFSLLLLTEECAPGGVHEKVIYPTAENDGKFAVCGKIAYGKKDPNYLIEWIEYQRYLGASKIVLYPYQDLHSDAMKVLLYYSQNGVIETVPLPLVPERNWIARYFPTQSSVMLNDEQVPMFDTQERLREYTYFTVIDTDEFIAPNRGIAKNYSQLMEYLSKSYPNAANFPMLTQFHAMTWSKTDPESDLLLGQYGYRSQSVPDRVKLIHVSDRIKPGTLWIHDGDPKPGYHKAFLNEFECVLKHYRFCQKEWMIPNQEFKPNKCFGGFKVQYDPYMTEIIATIGPNVHRTKKILNL